MAEYDKEIYLTVLFLFLLFIYEPLIYIVFYKHYLYAIRTVVGRIQDYNDPMVFVTLLVLDVLKKSHKVDIFSNIYTYQIDCQTYQIMYVVHRDYNVCLHLTIVNMDQIYTYYIHLLLRSIYPLTVINFNNNSVIIKS